MHPDQTSPRTPSDLVPAEAAAPRTARRRTVLGGLTAAAVAPFALASCGGAADPTEQASSAGVTGIKDILPTYVEQVAVEPDIPSENGSTPGYLTYPTELPQTVDAPPGKGSTFKAMVPTWSAVQASPDNAFTQALDAAFGADLTYEMTTGNDYRDKQAAVFASPNNVADWVSVYGWNPPARFDQAVTSVFQDLTPFLSGDNVTKWKNLANLPTDAWQYGVFEGKLYGIPVAGEIVTDAVFHRADILEGAGIEPPQTADEFMTACAELTDPSAGRWATNDMSTGAPNLMFGAPPDWRETSDGALEYRWETEEYRRSLEFLIELFEKGYVHPDVIANSGDSKQRFESGQVAFHYDGVGAWGEMANRLKDTNPEFRIGALSGLNAGGEPLRYAGAPANFFSFLKKTDDTARIEELLGIADFLAAPFGTKEWELVNFGEEGVHFTRDANGQPVPTEALAEQHPGVLSTLVTGPLAKYDFTNPDFVTAYCEWQKGETAHMVEGPFYGYKIIRPVEYATLDQPMYDLQSDIVRGRATLEDFDAAVTTWKNQGGDRMREYYQGVLTQLREAEGS